jgi:AmmeMemoRadiSam system protein B
VTAPLAQFALGHMDGETPIPDIVDKARNQARQQNVPDEVVEKITDEPIKALVGQLDAAGMLEGPVFDEMLTKLRDDFDSSDNLPPSATAEMVEQMGKQEAGDDASEDAVMETGRRKLAEAFDQMIDKVLENADDPSFDALPRAAFVPNLDYQRGWINFAAAYGRMRVCDRPDRVVVLAPNTFGRASGVTGCDKGFESPLGTCPLDRELLDAVTAELGDENARKFLAERFDHEREASIELQIPWLRHVFAGDSGEGPKVLGVLVHDALKNNGEALDAEGLGLEPFVAALRAALEKVGGNTLVVCSTSLSHVGPAFGDQMKLAQDDPQAEQARNRVVETDRNLLKSFGEGKFDELMNQMSWTKNATRWPGTGAMVAAAKAVDADAVRLLNYSAAADKQGMSLVSTFSAVVPR